MNGTQYEKNVLVTESNNFEKISERVNQKMCRMLHASLGLSSEISELKDALVGYETANAIDYTHLVEEVGDLCWYAAIAIHSSENDPVVLWPTNEANNLFSPLDALQDMVDTLTIDIGKLNNYLKRAIFYGKPWRECDLTDCLRSICCSLYCLSYQSGSDLSTVMEKNIAKLRARYGDKFSEAAAVNRNLTNERTVLENT